MRKARGTRFAMAFVLGLAAPIDASVPFVSSVRVPLVSNVRVPLVSNVRVPPPRSHLIEAAVRGGARRLAREDCARLLTDYRDASGRTLAENAQRLGRTASEYVDLVLFYGHDDADGRCRRRRLLAFTSPGSRVVRVCPELADVYRSYPPDAEIVIIHEVLHSLGLGENPPSSDEITARVAYRCGEG
jgi:hypothetical protein